MTVGVLPLSRKAIFERFPQEIAAAGAVMKDAGAEKAAAREKGEIILPKEERLAKGLVVEVGERQGAATALPANHAAQTPNDQPTRPATQETAPKRRELAAEKSRLKKFQT